MKSSKKILVVDDNIDNLNMVNEILKGLYKVIRVASGQIALQFLETQIPDLILLDVRMPEMTGHEFIKILKSRVEFASIPVIFLTSLKDVESEATAFELGAVDYIQKPFNTIIMRARVKQHLEMESYKRELEKLVEIKTARINLLHKITIDLLAHVNEYRDSDTGSHIKRTAKYVCVIMDNLIKRGLDSYYISVDYYDDIKKSAPLHDLGKICVPDNILLKEGYLTGEEFEIMKSHVDKGGELLKEAIVEFDGPSFLDVALEIVMGHHEKWDGTGYPNQLKGEDIPLSARIMAIADVYDALTSVRPYKEAFSHEKAMGIIIEGREKHFDPVLVDVFKDSEASILSISREMGVRI